jgi:hypothetical protein
MNVDLRNAGEWRYLRFAPTLLRIASIRGYAGGESVSRENWRASNLFAAYREEHWQRSLIHCAQRAWSATFTLDEIPRGSYLCVAVNGIHGVEGATAAFRIGGVHVGCPDRSPSFPSNTWESPVVAVDSNYTFYLPLSADHIGKTIEGVVLAFDPEHTDLKPEMWMTNGSPPFVERELVLER